MLPDLRFIIGAVLATAVLGVAALGLVSTIRLAQEARTPFDPTRPLAYTDPSPAARPSEPQQQQQPSPFDRMPTGSVTAQAPVAPATAPATEAAPATADDHESVDERAVVYPPLTPDGEEMDPASAASAPEAPAAPAVTTAPVEQEPAAEPTGSIPAAAALEADDTIPVRKAKAKAKAKQKTAARKAAKAAPRRSGNVLPPNASTGYAVERTPRAAGRAKRGNAFPFGD